MKEIVERALVNCYWIFYLRYELRPFRVQSKSHLVGKVMMGGLQKDCKEKSGRNCGKDDKLAESGVIEKLIVLDSPIVMIVFVLWVIHN